MANENQAPPSELMTDADAARYLDVAVATLRSWRLRNGRAQKSGPRRSAIKNPPPFVKIGRLVRYRRADLDQWIESNVHRAGGAAA